MVRPLNSTKTVVSTKKVVCCSLINRTSGVFLPLKRSFPLKPCPLNRSDAVYIFSAQGVPPRSLPTPVCALTAGRMFTSATSVEPSITTKRIHFCATPADSANTPSSSTLSHQGQFSYYVKIYQSPLVRNPSESRISAVRIVTYRQRL